MGCRHAHWLPEGFSVCVRCRVPEALQDDILALKRAFPRASLQRIADDLKLRRRDVSAALQEAMRREGLRVPLRVGS